MPKRKTLAQRASSLFGGSQQLAAGFKNAQAAALDTWRHNVRAFCDGKTVDLEQLLTVGPLIGIATANVHKTFAADCDVMAEHIERAATIATEQKLAKEAAAAAVGAEADIQKYMDLLADATRRRDAAGYTAMSLGYATGEQDRLEQSHPRLWDAAREADPVAFEQALSLEPDVDAELETIPPSTPLGDEAEWLNDSTPD